MIRFASAHAFRLGISFQRKPIISSYSSWGSLRAEATADVCIGSTLNVDVNNSVGLPRTSHVSMAHFRLVNFEALKITIIFLGTLTDYGPLEYSECHVCKLFHSLNGYYMDKRFSESSSVISLMHIIPTALRVLPHDLLKSPTQWSQNQTPTNHPM